MKKSTREQAIEWWNTVTYKGLIISKYFNGRRSHTLTGREIEEIWMKETQQILDTVDTDCAESFERINKLVDFELLKDSIPMIEACVDNCQPLWNNKIDNLKLFFDKLSTSSSFAHKAHKELNRLNQ